ncbi:MAG TPA: tRNA (adenosine(37)-N6)-dimethylallyltransferase MiaA [Mycobacteriales bacterium]|nr:tRNA (adenosine(37)-N6)-dimethylallyltransferase MiaA [Mycobacteriales bacterium]
MPRVLAVVGPTAAGKSEAALRLAERLGGEVVNADSMQLYRGMDVGTAKLTMEERRGVPHHLLDVWDVRETASVAAYQRLAREVLDTLDVAVVAGGSGLYVRGALDAFEFPGTDPAVRAALEAELAEHGPEALHARLAAADPAAAAEILPTNGRRVVRALEVVELTGRPFSARPGMAAYTSVYDTAFLGIDPGLDVLDARIDRRVDVMWRRGLVAEVADLAERHGLREGVTASRALGYQQVLAFLDGRTTEDEARAATKLATRRFARRQLKWFRRDPRIAWYPDADALVAAVAD